MNNELALGQITNVALIKALAVHDFKSLTDADRLAWVGAVCEATGVNPLGKVIDWITLQGKLVPYANKSFTDQLRSVRGISIKIVSQTHANGTYVVTVEATDKDGRTDSDVGAVALPEGAKGDALAMAIMKATTKAKRRVTLSMGGMGFVPMDESEVEDAQVVERVNVEVIDRPNLNKVVEEQIAASPAPEVVVKAVVTEPKVPGVPKPTDKIEDILYWSDKQLQADGLTDAQIKKADEDFSARRGIANLTAGKQEDLKAWIDAVASGKVSKFYKNK